MNKKKVIIISLLIGVLIIGVISFFSLKKKDITKITKSLTDDIIEQVEQKKDLLIYITDEESKCYLCPNSDEFINFYQEEYKLNFIHYNLSKNTQEEYKKLKNKLNIKDTDIKEPAVIIIQKGKVVSIVNEMINEVTLKEFLANAGLIQLTSADKQLSLDEFKEKFASNEKSLIAILAYNSNSLKARKVLLNLSKQHHFEYNITYYGISDGALISAELRSKTKNDNIDIPYIAVIQNNKIIDSISSNEEKKISSFLKKNNFIS